MNIELVDEYVSWGSEIKEYKLTNLNLGLNSDGICCTLNIRFRFRLRGGLNVICDIPCENELTQTYIVHYIKYDILLSGFGFNVDDIDKMVYSHFSLIYTNHDRYILTLDAERNEHIWNNLLDSYFIWSNTKL